MRLSTQIESLASSETHFSPFTALQATAAHAGALTGKDTRSSQAHFDRLHADEPIYIRGVEVARGEATLPYGGLFGENSVRIYRDGDGKLREEVRRHPRPGELRLGPTILFRPHERKFRERETFDTGSGTAVVTREESGDTASISIRNRDGKEMATVRFAPGHDGEVRNPRGQRIVSRLVPESFGPDGKPVFLRQINMAVGVGSR